MASQTGRVWRGSAPRRRAGKARASRPRVSWRGSRAHRPCDGRAAGGVRLTPVGRSPTCPGRRLRQPIGAWAAASESPVRSPLVVALGVSHQDGLSRLNCGHRKNRGHRADDPVGRRPRRHFHGLETGEATPLPGVLSRLRGRQDMTEVSAGTLAEMLDERQHLLEIALWMFGSEVTADRIVQETYRRWYALDDEERAGIAVPRAWLTRVAGSICLDLLAAPPDPRPSDHRHAVRRTPAPASGHRPDPAPGLHRFSPAARRPVRDTTMSPAGSPRPARRGTPRHCGRSWPRTRWS